MVPSVPRGVRAQVAAEEFMARAVAMVVGCQDSLMTAVYGPEGLQQLLWRLHMQVGAGCGRSADLAVLLSPLTCRAVAGNQHVGATCARLDSTTLVKHMLLQRLPCRMRAGNQHAGVACCSAVRMPV